MPFDWTEYLRLAEELAQRRQDEAALRSAVSRAYYASLCEARKHLLQKGVAISEDENSHQAVWNAFLNKGRTHAAIHTNGDRLRRWRVLADYREEVRSLPDLTENAIKTSRNVLNWLDRL